MLIIKKSFKTNPLINLPYYNVQHRNMGWFSNIPMAKPDAIFGLVSAYKKDPAKKKVNLSVGAFRTDENKPYILKCVRKAEKIIYKKKMNKEYLPMIGDAEFRQIVMDFTFGKDCEYNQPGKHVTLQGLSGTGGLSIVAQFLRWFFPGNKVVYISDPSWPNHHNLFKWMGVKTKNYRYYDKKKVALDFCAIMDDINKIPKKSIMLFHASGHNPTGFDPSIEQWKEIANAIKKRNMFVIMDSAYQGFASGDIHRDACAFRIMAKKRINLVLITSFAKNMGLYGERVGAVTFLVDNKEEAARMKSQLKLLIRANHSNPPIHGSRIVKTVFCNPDLFKLWKKEVEIMACRLKSMRKALVDKLKSAGSERNWDFLIKQIGMFAYSGLTVKQIKRLQKENHIYLLNSGRIAIPGLTTKNVGYVAKAIHKVTSK